MSRLDPILPKLGKIIPLLGSPEPGDVLAAARALQRTLATAEADLHDLAARVASVPPVLTTPPTWGGMGVEDRLRWLQALACSQGALSPWEESFVADIAARLQDWPHFAPSPKQRGILDRVLLSGWLQGVRP